MEANITGALTMAGGTVLGAALPALVDIVRAKRELAQLRTQLEKTDAAYQQLRNNYHDLLNKDLMVSNTRRLISFQLLVIDDHLRDDKKVDRYPVLEIFGINSLGPLHQGRELVRNVLRSSEEKDGYGGKVRVLLLDPRSEAFRLKGTKPVGS